MSFKANPKSYLVILISLAIIFAAVGIFLLNKQSPVNEQNEPTGTQAGILGGSVEDAPDGRKMYTDADYDFFFQYPDTFSVGAFSDGDGIKTILLQDAKKNTGVQIYISAFDEDVVLTAERIKKELPGVQVNNAAQVSMGGAKAVSFDSTNASIGESREVWFVYKGNLYQVSAPVASANDLDTMIKTWEWKN